MLSRDSRLWLLGLCILLILSCNEENKTKVESDILIEYIKSHFSLYKHIYSIANDSLAKWTKDSLEIMGLELRNPYQLDSVLCFNPDSSRLFGTVNDRCLAFKNENSDQIREFGGARIGGRWYFFFMSSLVVPREFYQDSVYSPLTFEELSYVAHKELYSGALTKKEDGTFAVNEAWMEQQFEDVFGDGKNANQDSSIYANCIASRQKKLDPIEVAQIKEEMSKSVRPPEPKKSLWERWFGEEKIFESEAWKNRKR